MAHELSNGMGKPSFMNLQFNSNEMKRNEAIIRFVDEILTHHQTEQPSIEEMMPSITEKTEIEPPTKKRKMNENACEDDVLELNVMSLDWDEYGLLAKEKRIKKVRQTRKN